jgi:hypothetical protein
MAAAAAASASQIAAADRAAAAFLRDVQRAVARDDRHAVSVLVQYPLVVTAGGVRIPIRDAAAFVQSYDLIFTLPMKAAIAEAASPSALRELRIEHVGGAFRITSMTVPLDSGAAAPARAAQRPTRREPQRLLLDVGRIQRAGALASGERDVFLLTAKKNQLLELRVNGVSGRDVVVRITSAKSAAPIDVRARDGVRTWIGRLPDDGEYRIEVVRLVSGRGELPYIFVISKR